MSEAQKHGAALTYGKRQSLTSVLGLTTADDDTDGVERGGKPDPITEGQLADLEALIEDVGADWQKFLAWHPEKISVIGYISALGFMRI